MPLMMKKKCPAHTSPFSSALTHFFLCGLRCPCPVSSAYACLSYCHRLLGQRGRFLQPANALPSSDALPPLDQSDTTDCHHPSRPDPLLLQSSETYPQHSSDLFVKLFDTIGTTVFGKIWANRNSTHSVYATIITSSITALTWRALPGSLGGPGGNHHICYSTRW